MHSLSLQSLTALRTRHVRQDIRRPTAMRNEQSGLLRRSWRKMMILTSLSWNSAWHRYWTVWAQANCWWDAACELGTRNPKNSSARCTGKRYTDGKGERRCSQRESTATVQQPPQNKRSTSTIARWQRLGPRSRSLPYSCTTSSTTTLVSGKDTALVSAGNHQHDNPSPTPIVPEEPGNLPASPSRSTDTTTPSTTQESPGVMRTRSGRFLVNPPSRLNLWFV